MIVMVNEVFVLRAKIPCGRRVVVGTDHRTDFAACQRVSNMPARIRLHNNICINKPQDISTGSLNSPVSGAAGMGAGSEIGIARAMTALWPLPRRG